MTYTIQIFWYRVHGDYGAADVVVTGLSQEQIRDDEDFLYVFEDGSETGYSKSHILEYRLIPEED